jgi:hypothetical protein
MRQQLLVVVLAVLVGTLAGLLMSSHIFRKAIAAAINASHLEAAFTYNLTYLLLLLLPDSNPLYNPSNMLMLSYCYCYCYRSSVLPCKP